MKITLNKPFASNTKVDEQDVRQVKRVLNRLGYYRPAKQGLNNIADSSVFSALKQFQSDHSLSPTGSLRQDDATFEQINAATKENSSDQYIWRTVGDGDVRSTHVARDGHTFRWSDNLRGGHPGEDYNCRCWAEPVASASAPIPKRKPQQPEFVEQIVTSSTHQSSRKWTDEDFKNHFWNGNGREVNLSETGWLVDVIFHAKNIIFHRVEKQLIKKVKETKSGNFTDTWENSYDFKNVVFSLGEISY